MINESATRDNIFKALSDENVVVYFAGHGEKDHIVVADEDMLENIRKGIRRETGGWQNPVLGYI